MGTAKRGKAFSPAPRCTTWVALCSTLAMLNQRVKRMRARVQQVAVNTREANKGNLAIIGKPLVQAQDLEVLHFADDELVPLTESNGGCRSRDLREALVNEVLVADNGIRLANNNGRLPQRTAELIQQRFQEPERLVMEHELRTATVRGVHAVLQIDEVLITDAVNTSVTAAIVRVGASSRNRRRAAVSNRGQDASGAVGASASGQVRFVATAQTDRKLLAQKRFKVKGAVLQK